MPGKQMSIDAELRAGGIDQAEASRRRQSLEQESQFFGAMDGAMKFVKGDAIAGIIIAAVNIAGGFGTGILQKGMSAGEAIQTYAILSIGDGLVSQIPSLLVSISAGMLVTRVNTGENGGLGKEIFRNIAGSPAVLYSVSAVLFALAAAPGLPAWPFALTAAGSLAGGLSKSRRTHISLAPSTPAGNSRKGIEICINPRVILEIPLLCFPGMPEAERTALISAAIKAEQRSIGSVWGIRIPGIRADVTEGQSMKIKIGGVTVAESEKVMPAGISPADLGKFVRCSLAAHLPDFLGIQETHDMVEELQSVSPVLIRETIPKMLSYAKLCELLRRLLEERVPVSDLGTILEAVAGCGPVDNMNMLVEHVRSMMKRQICAAAGGGAGKLNVILVDRSVEGAIIDGTADSGGRQSLAMQPDTARAIVASIRGALDLAAGTSPAVLTDISCRRFLRKILECELPDVPVLSYSELAPEITVEPVGKAALA